MLRQRLMWIAWPAFMVAAALEMMVFAVLDPLSLTLRKNDDAFRKIVTGEIHRLITQGEINGMYRKWFESPIPPNQVNLKLPMSYLLRDSFKSPTEWLP